MLVLAIYIVGLLPNIREMMLDTKDKSMVILIGMIGVYMLLIFDNYKTQLYHKWYHIFNYVLLCLLSPMAFYLYYPQTKRYI